jgi:alkanesulfonate monooxygenase SsuD/methylene tetrahydromethanopterin reductase-like flavin-dependent oxidoreductase (luciferase family)
MRFGMFHEIEVRGRTAEIEQQTFRNVVKQVIRADELGYESAWFVEHHFTKGFSHSSAPDIVVAHLSGLTKSIRLGLGVVLLPFVNPIRTAERVATLDILSSGRIEFGTGRGASPLEYRAFGQPFELSRKLWEDNLGTVLDIWKADRNPLFVERGQWLVPDVGVYPGPVQRPHPPVWVASTSLDGFLSAARRGYNLLCMPIVKGLEALAGDIAEYKRELAANGFDPEARRVGMLVPAHIASTESEAERANDAVLWYIRRQVNLVIPPDFTDARHATYKVMGQLAAGMPPESALDLIRKERMVFIGDVAEARAAVTDYEAAGATDLLLQFQVGGLQHEHVMESIELSAREFLAPDVATAVS